MPITEADELIHVDPSTLILGPNVRADTRPDKALVASVKERGVLVPIVGYRNVDGDLIVRYGARRTLAAIEAKRSRVPVTVTTEPVEADRIVDQMAENDHRTDLTVGERVAAYEQLAMLGLSAAQIAKRTATDREQVNAGLAAAKSPTAKQALTEHASMTLPQLAALAEFEDDADAVTRLLQRASDGRGFDHAAQQLRDERAERAESIAAGAELAAAGIRVVAEPKDPWNLELDNLVHYGESLTAETHAACPGHAVFMDRDWDAEEDEAAGDGEAPKRWQPVYICLDPKQYGHDDSREAKRVADDAELAKIREKAEAQKREDEANTKAWTSAQKVRRAWLRTFVARKTPPKGAAVWIAQTLGDFDYPLRSGLASGHKLAMQTLGVADYKPQYGSTNNAMVGLLDGTTDNRAQVVTLALILCAIEENLGARHWQAEITSTRRYLRFLEDQGYELSDIELRACGVKPTKRSAKARTTAVAGHP